MAKKHRQAKSTRRRRSGADLQGVWEHVVYEIQMLVETGRFLTTFKADPSSDKDRVKQNAFIESFAIHARALTAFLYPNEPHPDDVVADDFFANPSTWRSNRPPMTDTLRRIHPRVGKEVAHLTYTRTTIMPEERGWPFVPIVIEIGLVLREFLRMLPDDFPKPSLQQIPTLPVPTEGIIAISDTGEMIVTEVASRGLG